MTADRDYILMRCKTKSMTADQFEYEKLSCPYSIIQLFSNNDLWLLYEYASSPKYSSKPVEKTKLIDQLMRSRGFIKLQGGTNRICYKFIEDSSFVVKVAYDNGGLKDNPAEFYNQKFLNPFCTKVFECAPNGAVATFERVHGIKSREEFYTIHAEVFRLIKEFIIPCGFLMEDIGTEFFMNYGVREGFGPVLLDFSFLYQVDTKKLYCSKPDYNSPTGCCEGEIDYDPGYNFLYCTKCGIKYKAIELSKRLADNTTLIRGRKRIGGRKQMKLTFNGGDHNYNNETIVAEGNKFANNIPKMEVKESSIRTEKPEGKRTNVKFNLDIKGGDKEVVKEDAVEEKQEEVKAVEESKVETTMVVYPEVVKQEEETKEEDSLIEVSRFGELDKSDGESPVDMITEDSFIADLGMVAAGFSYLVSNTENSESLNDAIITLLDSLCITSPSLKDAIEQHFAPAPEDDGNDYYYYDDEAEDASVDVEEKEDDTRVDCEPIAEEESAETTESEIDTTEYSSDVARFEAVVTDIHDIIDSIPSEKVLLIKNIGAEGYVTVGDNQLFVVDMIDGNYISSISITSKDYLENLEKEVAQYENLEVKEAPVGV